MVHKDNKFNTITWKNAPNYYIVNTSILVAEKNLLHSHDKEHEIICYYFESFLTF